MTEAVTSAGVEAALLDRLRARIAGVAIEPFPDDPETDTLLHQVGALLLAYAGAEDGPPEALGLVVQERVLRFDVHIVARRLSGAGGAQRLLGGGAAHAAGLPQGRLPAGAPAGRQRCRARQRDVDLRPDRGHPDRGHRRRGGGRRAAGRGADRLRGSVMTDQRYKYDGPPSGVTLADGREVLLRPGREVELPPGHPWVAALVAQRRLVPVEED